MYSLYTLGIYYCAFKSSMMITPIKAAYWAVKQLFHKLCPLVEVAVLGFWAIHKVLNFTVSHRQIVYAVCIQCCYTSQIHLISFPKLSHSYFHTATILAILACWCCANSYKPTVKRNILLLGRVLSLFLQLSKNIAPH